MNAEKIKERIDSLITTSENSEDEITSTELRNATLNLLSMLYGSRSLQVDNFLKECDFIQRIYQSRFSIHIYNLSVKTLKNLKSEIDWGLIGSLQKSITGEVLTDFLQLSRAALEEKGDDAKNVSAVLTAALFEDTIRRLATANGISHIEKLADVLTELKTKGILDGTQVGVAQSYLTFRNKSLHAEWDKVGRETVASVMAFTEQLLLKHFS